jgi:hypothetical protein
MTEEKRAHGPDFARLRTTGLMLFLLLAQQPIGEE